MTNSLIYEHVNPWNKRVGPQVL